MLEPTGSLYRPNKRFSSSDGGIFGDLGIDTGEVRSNLRVRAELRLSPFHDGFTIVRRRGGISYFFSSARIMNAGLSASISTPFRSKNACRSPPIRSVS